MQLSVNGAEHPTEIRRPATRVAQKSLGPRKAASGSRGSAAITADAGPQEPRLRPPSTERSPGLRAGLDRLRSLPAARHAAEGAARRIRDEGDPDDPATRLPH